jgi:hypothetical protein
MRQDSFSITVKKADTLKVLEINMKKYDNPLINIQIASPCKSDWNAMSGDNRKRFCGECNLNVYNLSGMSKTEAETLLIESEGRVCVRLYKRSDGSVITKDCPVGFAKVKQRVQLVVTASISLVFTFFGAIGLQSVFGKQISSSVKYSNEFAAPTPRKLMGIVVKPSPTPKKTATPKPTPTPEPEVLMGRPATPKSDGRKENVNRSENRTS